VTRILSKSSDFWRIGSIKALLRPMSAIRSNPVEIKGIRSSSIPVGSRNLKAQNVRSFAKLRSISGCILIFTWLPRPRRD